MLAAKSMTSALQTLQKYGTKS